MCSSPQQDINIEMSRGDKKRVRVSRGNNGVAVRETYAEVSVRDDFLVGQARRVGVEVAADYLQVGGYGAQEVEGGRVGQVAETEDLADFAGGEEFFELWFGEGVSLL